MTERYRGLTKAMIEALRRVHRGVPLDADPGVLRMTLVALRDRGLMNVHFYVQDGRIRTDAQVTATGLKKLLQVADVKLEEWRGVP